MALQLAFDDAQQATLFDLLGIPPDTELEVDALLEVLDDALDPDNDEDPQPSKVAAIANRLGLDVVDTDSLAALRRDAEQGRRLTAQLARTKVENLVDDAIRRGKITVARRKHWVDLVGADPAMADVLNNIEDETAVPLTEVGHSIDPDEDTTATTWFR